MLQTNTAVLKTANCLYFKNRLLGAGTHNIDWHCCQMFFPFHQLKMAPAIYMRIHFCRVWSTHPPLSCHRQLTLADLEALESKNSFAVNLNFCWFYFSSVIKTGNTILLKEGPYNLTFKIKFMTRVDQLKLMCNSQWVKQNMRTLI
jgi:hypothetical protein